MTTREGSLERPTRHPIDWRNPQFLDQEALDKELERVFDICHGCRRCVSLCASFPTLFDLIDEGKTGEMDGVDKADYKKVVDATKELERPDEVKWHTLRHTAASLWIMRARISQRAELQTSPIACT